MQFEVQFGAQSRETGGFIWGKVERADPEHDSTHVNGATACRMCAGTTARPRGCG